MIEEEALDNYPSVWVRDTRMELAHPDSNRKCRAGLQGFGGHRYCQNPAVVRFKRSNGWWYYCAEHMYGRRIRDGIVEIEVAADSIAGQRGYTE